METKGSAYLKVLSDFLRAVALNLRNQKTYILIYIAVSFVLCVKLMPGGLNVFGLRHAMIGVVLLTSIGLIVLPRTIERIHFYAFFVIFVTGVLFVFFVPILDHPDEPIHFIRAEITSRLELFPDGNDGSGYEIIQSVQDLNAVAKKTILNTKADNLPINYTIVNVNNAAVSNSFVGYIPQAIGILLAKILSLNSIWLMWLGRLFNLCFYTIICTLAIRIAPKYKIPLFVVACIPMAVYQGASLSIDASINSLALLVIACFLKMYFAERSCISIKQQLLFFTICFLLGWLKITYAPFAFLIFLVPQNKFMSKYYLLFNILGSVAVFSLCFGWYLFTTKLPVIENEQTAYTTETGVNFNEQLTYIFNHKGRTLRLFISEYSSQLTLFMQQLFTFGWFSYGIGNDYIYYFIMFGALALCYPSEMELSMLSRVLLLLLCLAIVVGTMMIFYLSWTTVGASTIEGVQGRYFIPLFALIPMIINLNSKVKIRNENNDQKISYNNFFIFSTVFFISQVLLTTIIHYY